MNLPFEKRRRWMASRREKRKLTRQARLFRQLLRFSILSLLLFGGGTAFYKIHWYVPDNDHNCQSIIIQGNQVASEKQIRQALNLPVSAHTPIFSLDPQQLNNEIETLSMVKRAFVRRYSLPKPKLQIEIMEEFPWTTLCLDTTEKPTFVIAESGRLISIEDFPHVYQPKLTIYAQAKDNINFNASKVSQWANLAAYIEKQTQAPVLSIDMRDAHDIKVETGKFIIALGNPDNSLTSRLYRLASVLDVMSKENKAPAYINLGLNSNIPVKLAQKISPTSEQANN